MKYFLIGSMILSLIIIILISMFQSKNHYIILPNDSLQQIVVTTANWESVTGTLQLFARETSADSWHVIGESENVMIGRNGLGWSPDFALLGLTGPFKQEGDGKAPAGVFYLNSVFGEIPAPQFLKMPYLQVEEPWICVDDIRSTYYNHLINSSLLTKSEQDWESYEQMRRIDNLYQWGIIIDYNRMPIIPGRGSCIFLHLWRDPTTPTAGCTAMSLPTMEKLLTWLDIDKKPVLVQLPQHEFINRVLQKEVILFAQQNDERN